MLLLNIDLGSGPTIKLPPDSRRSQISKLNPLREDLEAYMMHIRRIVEYANSVERDARARLKTSLDETNALHQETRTQLTQRAEELLDKVHDDYARLIDPLTEYRETLIRERDVLEADFRKEQEERLMEFTKRLCEIMHQGKQWYDKLQCNTDKFTKDAEHKAYLDLKKITNEKRFGASKKGQNDTKTKA